MTNPVMVVHTTRRFGEVRPVWYSCWMWCPGCDASVMIPVKGPTGDMPPGTNWDWNGSTERPTFDPSILQHKSGSRPLCHSYVRDGRWQFLSDCEHSLAGQTVDMVPLPDWLCKYAYDLSEDEEVTWP